MNKNKKIIIALITIVAIVAVISTFVLALFTAREGDKATIKLSNLDVVLKEDWPEPDDVPETGIDRHSKDVWGESLADKKAYVRLRFIPVVEYLYEDFDEDGDMISEWRTAPISQNVINLTVETNDNFVKDGDYYYYKKILNSHETTEKMNIAWQIIEIPSTLEGYKIRTDVRVILEYSQVENEVWKDVFKIDQLPDGVEK